MRKRSTAAVAIAAAALAVFATQAGATLIGVYSNTMKTEADRATVKKLYGPRCGQLESKRGFSMILGKPTRECAFRTPVVGRDLEIAAVERMGVKTPKPVANRAYLSVKLRAGRSGSGYELAVFPVQQKAQLREILPDGTVKYLHIERNVEAIAGVGRPNVLRLRAFNVTSGPEQGLCEIVASVGRTVVAEATDSSSGQLQGRASAFAAGSMGPTKNLRVTIGRVVVRIPDPFA